MDLSGGAHSGQSELNAWSNVGSPNKDGGSNGHDSRTCFVLSGRPFFCRGTDKRKTTVQNKQKQKEKSEKELPNHESKIRK